MPDSRSSSANSWRPTSPAPSRAALLLATLSACALLAAPRLRAQGTAQAPSAQTPTAETPTAQAAPTKAEEAARKAEEEAAAEKAKRRDTIKYGIDSEILDLVRVLQSDKESAYNEELSALLDRTKNPKLRAAILDFFASLEWKGAESRALDLVESRDGLDPTSVSSALYYLAAVKSKKALGFSQALIQEDDKKILPALIRLLGRAGGEEEERLLLGWFESDAATDSLKQEAIRALGEIGSSKAAERLAALAKDPEAKSGNRMEACAALGKIKDVSSVPALVAAANGDDANVRAKAVEALGSFSDAASASALIEALRDSMPKVRVAACKGISARGIGDASPFLRYKATSDPERGVKIEALRALAALGGDSFAFLRERMGDKKTELQLRALCFGLLMRRDPASMEALCAAFKAEAAEKERSVYTAYLRELSGATDAPGAAPLARVALADKDPLMRIGAVEWARKSRPSDFLADLERLVAEDPSELIRKRAAAALESLRGKD